MAQISADQDWTLYPLVLKPKLYLKVMKPLSPTTRIDSNIAAVSLFQKSILLSFDFSLEP